MILKRKLVRQKGQAFIEYVILIVVVALAALLVLTAFSDRLREMVNGVTTTLGGEAKSTESSGQILKELKSDGVSIE